MGTQDENKKITSKIEQIRLDLEKKLAAIEKSKNDIKSEEPVISEKSEVNISNDSNVDAIVNNENDLSNNLEESPAFEITEPIEVINEEVVQPLVKNKEVSKENNLKKEEVKKSIVVDRKEKIIASSISKELSSDNNKISTPPKTVISSISSESVKNNEVDEKASFYNEKEDEVEEFEEKKKKKGINYVFYALLVLFFLGLGYYFFDYMAENNKVKNEIMDQKLSEFKNKRYLDSIELADLNYQILDMQSKKMIDSLDLIYEKELIANSKLTNKKAIKRNFTPNKKSNRESLTAKSNNSAIKSATTSSNELSSVNKNEDGNNENIIKDVAENENNINNSQLKSESLISENSPNKDIKKDEKGKEKQIKKELENTPKIVVAPIYPGCEKKKNKLDRKKCFFSKTFRHVSRKFNADLAQNMGLKEGMHQVRVNYVIDRNGYATVLNVRGENKKLEGEAIRVIQSLPKMKPGTVNGKKTKLQYNIPIKFIVNN